jgi:hypothetical protein
MLWTPMCNHNFEVKSFIIFYSLESLALPISMEEHLKVKALPCIAFFTWTAALD